MQPNDVLTIILSIGIPMLAGFGWMIYLIFDFRKELGDKISHGDEALAVRISSIDQRLSKLEGYIMGKDAFHDAK